MVCADSQFRAQGDRAYFDEAVTQTVAGNIAEAFNHSARERGLDSVTIRMLPVSVVQLIESVSPHPSPSSCFPYV